MSARSVAFSSAGGGSASAAGGARPKLERAFLALHDPRPAGSGGSRLGGQRDRINFQFNPRELTITKSAKWEPHTARNSQKAGPPEFQGPEPCSLTLEMFFDASEKQDERVVEAVDKLFSCCIPTQDSVTAKKALPPLVVFHWGRITGFVAYIKSVSAKYTLFTVGGTPIRATCTVQLQEMPGENGRQNPTSGALTARRRHTMVAGDTLPSVSFREYGDPTLWRVLAEANDIDDPLRVPSGTTLLLPAIEEIATHH